MRIQTQRKIRRQAAQISKIAIVGNKGLIDGDITVENEATASDFEVEPTREK
jgi:hypothetical protein